MIDNQDNPEGDVVPASLETLIGIAAPPIGWVMINNPARRNAMSRAMWDAMPRILDAFRERSDIRVLIFKGVGGKAFVSGADISEFEQQRSSPDAEAAYTADLLEEWGIPQSAIIFEGNSRNTRENAVETSRLLKNRQLNRVLLVTSAFHMPRALATFRGVGIHAIPSASSISAELAQPTLLNWIPSLDGLGTMQSVVHEKIGIYIYRMRGWLDA